MQVGDGLRKSPQTPRPPRPWRKRLGEKCRIACQRVMNQLAQHVLREPCGRRIDRREAFRQRRAGSDDLKSRMDHLQAELTVAHFAEGANALAGCKGLLLIGIEMKKTQHELIVANDLRECYIRPIANRGYGQMGLNPLEAPVEVTIACWEWGAYLGEEGKRDGVRAKVSSWRRISRLLRGWKIRVTCP